MNPLPCPAPERSSRSVLAGIPFAAAFTASGALFLSLALPTPAAQRQMLRGHVPAATARLQPIERLPGTRRLDLTLALPLRNQDALDRLLQQLYEPASTNFHHFLTPSEFAERFAPTQTDHEALISFAKANGLTVVGTHPNRMLVDVNGSVEQIEKAFHLNLRVYSHPSEGRTFFAPDVEPSLDLSVPVLAIGGLDDYVLPRPMNLRAASFHRVPNDNTNGTAYATGSGPRGAFIGRDFRVAYAPGVELTGAGQTVGLFELDGFFPNDITTYANLAGLPEVPVTTVLVSGFSGQPGGNNLEVALDIDMALSMAPGLSRVIVYEGRSANDVLNRMATDNSARQLSCSWGFGPQVDAARQQIFQEFAAQGQSFFQASGDIGAYPAAVYPPSDDPFITVVGGTVLTTSSPGGAWLSETAWPFGGGGGSTSYALPIWQQGISMTANLGSVTRRNIPDVACLADQVIWLVANNGEQGVVGGTSASAPLWASFTALVNQAGAATGKPSVGFVNPALYTIGKASSYGAAFHDITTGSNTNSSSPTKFFAVPGYDLCTGWGTPTGSNLISALLAPVPALQITPGTAAVFTGPVGGPFKPVAQSYLLTNNGTGPLPWTAVTTAPWVDVSPKSNTLTAGGPAATVNVTLTSQAASLPASSYAAVVWFTNVNDLSAQSRPVILNVVTPPVITSQPANQVVLEGTTATFSVGTASNAFLSFQWQHDNGVALTNLTDGGNISGSSSSTLTISDVSDDDAGAYFVIVSNAAGTVTSSNAFLGVVPWRPVITVQPTNQTAVPGQTVMLAVEAIGSEPLFYRWQQNGVSLFDGGNVSGAATRALILSNVSATNAGTYSVMVGNGLGLVASSNAVLTVVALTAPGVTASTLYSFSGANDGANPNGLVFGPNGALYGTTQGGGTNFSGTVFSVATNGALTGLYSFAGGDDGANPFAPLARGPDGNFYGTTFQGGASDNGTVFKVTPSGALSPLVALDFSIGDLPYGALVLGTDGAFHGTTYQGGGFGRGTVFSMTTNGALTTTCSFSGGSDGGLVYAGLTEGDGGNFYGTTYRGGNYDDGIVFRIAPNGLLTTLVSFNSTNGAFPYAGLVRGDDGNFYGATGGGGAHGYGTLFRITPTGQLTSLYSFTGGSDGSLPVAGLWHGADGYFYGSTAYGGAYGDGTLFKIAPDGAFTTLLQFDGYNGANPLAALVQGPDGALYGATQNGGATGDGVLFRLSTAAAPQITTQPLSQTAYLGASVQLSVIVSGGPTFAYQWRENGTNLLDTTGISGSASRVLSLTNITAASAGTYSVLVTNALGQALSADAVLQVTSSPPVIVVQPASLTLAPGAVATFSVAAVGNQPLSYRWRLNATPLTDTGNLYGSATTVLTITNVTEANNGSYSVLVSNALNTVPSADAVLSVVPPSAPGTRLTTLHFFGGTDGALPNGLVQGADGFLYGTTTYGGTHGIFGAGTVFRASTNGDFTSLYSFTGGQDGFSPRAGLAQGADGFFYGTTLFGGTNYAGNIFRIAADGAITNLYSFPGDNGVANPSATLLQGPDGDFYGTTKYAGSEGDGSVFKVTPGGVLTTLYSFTNGPDGAFPTNALALGPDGTFYGMAQYGAFGHGNIFNITSNGVFSLLYSFANGADGGGPQGPLALGADGNFYGATAYNTIQNIPFYGTIFKMTPAGALSTLYALNFYDGTHPAAGVIQGIDGNFYGTTYTDGTTHNGTLFRIAPNGTLTTLVVFDGFNNGAHPESALVQAADGTLYGTCTAGGPGGKGTLFRLAVTGAPQITAPPVSQAVVAGSNAQFSVAVFGAAPLSYQWLKNGAPLADTGNVFGSTSRLLNFTNVISANAGTYSVVVSNTLNSVTSATALLTVVGTPLIQSAQRAGNTVTLTWTATVGQRYRLQYKNSLAASSWTSIGNFVLANTTTMTGSDTAASTPQRFYRVQFFPTPH